MKKITSIKAKITCWYTILMLVLALIVLWLVSAMSYQLSMENIEKDIISQVSQVAEQINSRESQNIIRAIESGKDFKNVIIYLGTDEYVTGLYAYDVSQIEFKEDVLRHEFVDGEEYIVYDSFTVTKPEDRYNYWIRGIEVINYTEIFSGSLFTTILAVIPIILLLAIGGGYYITRKAFLPINNIICTANKISTQNDITQRIEVDSYAHKDELYNLSVTLNGMLDKIENLIKQEKQFTSDASHELRTPISVILAQGEYLLDIAENEKEQELAANIVKKATQVTKLISRLLLLARIDQSRQKIKKEKVDLGVLFDIAADSMKDLAEQKGIQLITNAEENMIVDADESLFLSAITNLVSNGIKYGKEGGYVKLSAFKSANGTEIVVADNGIGISAENVDKIWKRFYRVDDVRNDEYGSSGLGLAMVKSIIELHGGEICVKSELGKGTEFRVLLF